MGCVAADTLSISTDTLKIQLKKLKYSLNLYKLRVDKERTKVEELLYIQFLKPVKQRSKKLERAMIIGNTRHLIQQNIYSLIQNQTNILLQHSKFLDQQNKLNNIRDPLNVLSFCSTFMNCEQLQRFESMIRQVYPNLPFPTESQINNQMIKKQKKKEVPFKQEIEYLFQFSSNYSVSMEIINQVGHNYKYGAERYQG